MSKKFKIEIRKTCKKCGKQLPFRFRTYCSKECRLKATNKRLKKYNLEWQKKRRDKLASKPSRKKIQCLICGKWYRQVCTHVWRAHKIKARDYRKMFGLDIKRGLLPQDLRLLYSEQVFENGTINNLKNGKKFRFVKGDPRAGKYTRSAQTLERLRTQRLKNKK